MQFPTLVMLTVSIAQAKFWTFQFRVLVHLHLPLQFFTCLRWYLIRSWLLTFLGVLSNCVRFSCGYAAEHTPCTPLPNIWSQPVSAWKIPCSVDDAYAIKNDVTFFWPVLIKSCLNSWTPKSGYNMADIKTKSVSVDFLNRQFKLLFAMFIAWRKTCLSASSWLQVASTWSWGWFLRVVLLKAVTTSFLNRKYNLSWKILKQLPFVCVNA